MGLMSSRDACLPVVRRGFMSAAGRRRGDDANLSRKVTGSPGETV
jgi:hypothetical protein